MASGTIGSSEIVITSLLGHGQYGKVYKGKCRGMEVAVKVPMRQDLAEKTLEQLRKEVHIMSNLYHPNVCLFMGACLEKGKIQIVSELMEGDLTKLIGPKSEKTKISTRMGWALEAAKGISWMHAKSPPILHLDIKPDNILFDSDRRIKVCDFGFSLFKAGEENRIERPTGTPLFMSPEMLCAQKNMPAVITEKSDVYSFGILMWEILTKEKAFSHHRDFGAFRRAIIAGERPPIPNYCLPNLRALLNSCWSGISSERPSFDEIANQLTIIIAEYQDVEKQHEVQSDIADIQANKFWSLYFQYQDSADLKSFIQSFLTELNRDLNIFGDIPQFTENSLEIRCLKELLLEFSPDGNTVPRKIFGKLLGWFGPLTFPYQPYPSHMITRILETVRLPYFHGSLSGSEAATKLSRHQSGSFLVRFSGNHPKSFCISRVSPSGGPIKHLVVPCKAGKFYYKDKCFNSISDLAVAAKDEIHLQCYCQSDKYKSLFDTQTLTTPSIEGAYITDGTDMDDMFD